MNNLNEYLTDIANAIREKKGITDEINAADFSNEIRNISTGGNININGTIGDYIVSDNDSIKSGDFVEIDGVKYDTAKYKVGEFSSEDSTFSVQHVIEIGNNNIFVFYYCNSYYYGTVIKMQDEKFIAGTSTLLQSSLGGISFLKVDNNHFLISCRASNGANEYNIYIDYITINDDLSLSIYRSSNKIRAGYSGCNTMIILNEKPVVLHTCGNSTTLNLTEIELNENNVIIGARTILGLTNVSTYYSVCCTKLMINTYMLYFSDYSNGKYYICLFCYNIESQTYENSTPIVFTDAKESPRLPINKIKNFVYNEIVVNDSSSYKTLSNVTFFIDIDNFSLSSKKTLLVSQNYLYLQAKKQLKYNSFVLFAYHGVIEQKKPYFLTSYIVNDDGSASIIDELQIFHPVSDTTQFYQPYIMSLGTNAFALVYENYSYNQVFCNTYYYLRNVLIPYEDNKAVSSIQYSSNIRAFENIYGKDCLFFMYYKSFYIYNFDFFGTFLKKYESKIDGVALNTRTAGETIQAIIAN